MKLNRKILAIAALTMIAGRANAEALDTGVSKSIGGELLINCHGAFENHLVNSDGDALKLISNTRTQLSAPVDDSEPLATYSGEDRFSIDATCEVQLDVTCAAQYMDGGGECRFINEKSYLAASWAAVPDEEKIEAGQGIRIVRDAGGSEVGPNDSAMVVSPANGVVEEDFRVTYEAILGLDYSDNEEGFYHLDATLTMSEAD